MGRNRLIHLVPNIRAHEQLCARILDGGVAECPEPHLQALTEFVRDHNPYYRALLQKHGDFSRTAPLTKSLIQENFERIQSSKIAGPTFKNSSGGSTGKPQTFVQDAEYDRWVRATEYYYYRAFLGVNPLDVRKVVLWGSERDTFKERDLKGALINHLSGTVFLNTFRATAADWERYIEVINRIKPHFVKGYAGSLHHIAAVAKKRNLRLFSPRFVYSSAETLQDFMRKEIEECFGAKVYDFYGSREVGPIAGECRSGKRHIFSFNNHIEVVDKAGAPLSKAPGRILVTNLHNYAMPLIRYEIGDVGTLGEGACGCGSNLPWFEKLQGRITEHFVTKDDTLVHGEYFTHLFYYREWAREFQVSQLDYDRVEIAVVGDGASPEAQAGRVEIEEKIRFVLGPACRIDWKFVDSIPPTPQGKHLYTRCLVAPRGG